MKKAAGKSECVKVAVRVRPMNQKEKEEKSKVCVQVNTDSHTVTINSDKNNDKTFQFDYVYPMTSTQREVYDQVAFPIVDSIFQGYNGTIFAYGQTGCGKTFTMMGVVSDPELRGVIPSSFHHIFGYIKTEGNSKKFLIRCSFVEIYNEEVRDLLGNSNRKLDIREDPKKGTFVKDLNYVTLCDTNDIEKALNKGNKNRHVGATEMNAQSSRSHSLFTVYVDMEEGEEEKDKKIKHGKLNLVDLAGSERVGKTNATGQTFDEGKKINLSLTALGSVIDALSQNRKHIPYKDSKLTRLLSDSLGGNTRTVMFANISPASYNYDETLGTLRYASRAKLIKNAPKINEDPKDAHIRQLQEEIKALKEQLSGGGILKGISTKNGGEDESGPANGGIGVDEEKEELMARVKELERNLEEKNELRGSFAFNISDNQDNFKEYREKQLKANEEMEQKLKQLEEEKKKQEENLKNDVNALQKRIKELNEEVEDLRNEKENIRGDFLDEIKSANKTADMYREMLGFLLTEGEIKRIIGKSRYIEDDDKWIIQPFCIKEKKLVLPNMKPNQVSGFIEGNIEKRDLIINGEKSTVIQGFKNYSNEVPNNEQSDLINRQNNIKIINRTNDPSSNTKKLRLNLKDFSPLSPKTYNGAETALNNGRVNFRTKEKIQIISKSNKSQPVGGNILRGQTTFNKIHKIGDEEENGEIEREDNDDEYNIGMGNGGMTGALLSRKEREKLEELSNLKNKKNLYLSSTNFGNNNQRNKGVSFNSNNSKKKPNHGD